MRDGLSRAAKPPLTSPSAMRGGAPMAAFGRLCRAGRGMHRALRDVRSIRSAAGASPPPSFLPFTLSENVRALFGNRATLCEKREFVEYLLDGVVLTNVRIVVCLVDAILATLLATLCEKREFQGTLLDMLF